jgi:hypothetical protein
MVHARNCINGLSTSLKLMRDASNRRALASGVSPAHLIGHKM